MKFKNFLNEEDLKPEINLTPLIDTTLVLLIMILMSVPISHNIIKISLPSGKIVEKKSTNDICFAIDQYGHIYGKNRKKISTSIAATMLIEHNIKNPDSSCVIFADKDGACGNIIEFIDMAKECGINNVYCKTKKIFF
jgi:biopolymer transport protein ExbD